MRRPTILSALPLLLLLAAPASVAAQELLGFTDRSAAAQIDLERRYDALLRPENLESWMRELTDRPFYVASPGARENARFLVDLFRAWGYETEIATYQVLFPTPKERRLEMVAPVRYRARLEEPAVAGDASSRVSGRLPTYNAYSADGDVTGELVYVNYGVPADYEELERRGISVAGKIVIARYGGSWRGIKPKVAAEHGAIGAILYSDPRDDGYWQGDVYPEGAYRNEWGVQRGAVQDMPRYPGDPLTPGVGATADAERYTVEESPTIMKIPVLPISWGDARPLLEQIGGPVAPPAWRGALPLTYHIGPGPARVRLRLAFDWSLQPAENIIARLPGATAPDEWVIRGNHRDGWAMGAMDPISGLVALLEEARAVGELARAGHRPDRTIIYAAWDAEEPGLLGSTEWAEHHADELRAKAVAYINTDASGRGFLSMGGSHTLERFINQVAADVPDPQTGVTIQQRARAARAVGGDDVLGSRDLPISPLGSGSDYTPFLQHLGIASLNLGFGGESGGGSYHSQYDSFEHYTRFGDPGFPYGIALARVAGRATLRLANADLVPLRFTNFADRVEEYLDDVKALAGRVRNDAERTNRLLAMDAFRLAADPRETYFAPDSAPPVPFLNFAPLENAVARLQDAAAAFDDDAARALERGVDPGTAVRVNALLIRTERLMTREEGLPRRPWFRHMIYAPGFYTGYGVKTLPGVREGLEEEGYAEAEAFVAHIAERLEAVTAALREASVLLR
ncbi:MAG TPA: transferrin receptor-like dimerization domain-containing protein [Longimicrobiales bacterium]|nr:transferrin receptor-like dimerization domain-containing protein [Longimicrobiales bacterium]